MILPGGAQFLHDLVGGNMYKLENSKFRIHSCSHSLHSIIFNSLIREIRPFMAIFRPVYCIHDILDDFAGRGSVFTWSGWWDHVQVGKLKISHPFMHSFPLFNHFPFAHTRNKPNYCNFSTSVLYTRHSWWFCREGLSFYMIWLVGPRTSWKTQNFASIHAFIPFIQSFSVCSYAK